MSTVQLRPIQDPQQLHQRSLLKFYHLIAMLFVVLFLITNIIAQKIVPLGTKLVLTAGDFVYPLMYFVSMLLTEVYGYALSRQVIWSAFINNLLMVLIITLAIQLPAADCWQQQAAFATVLGAAPRLWLASLAAFLFGEFIGTYLLAKIKILTQGRYLWLRTFSATLIGQLIDSLIFTVIAFYGIHSWENVLLLSGAAYGCKLFYQLLLTPLSYPVVNFLKQQENLDIFDHHTRFNPLKFWR